MKTQKETKKNKKVLSYFDFSLSKKKKLVLAAARGSNELQLELANKYDLKIKQNGR